MFGGSPRPFHGGNGGGGEGGQSAEVKLAGDGYLYPDCTGLKGPLSRTDGAPLPSATPGPRKWGTRGPRASEDPEGEIPALFRSPGPWPKPVSPGVRKDCFQFLLLLTPISLGSLAYQEKGERPGSQCVSIVNREIQLGLHCGRGAA